MTQRRPRDHRRPPHSNRQARPAPRIARLHLCAPSHYPTLCPQLTLAHMTALRLQLLEPEKYPYLLKAMYGLLMLLPQSSAFVTLRNRLSAVSSLGLLQSSPKRVPRLSRPAIPLTLILRRTYVATAAAATTRSTIRRPDDIRWGELLTHFRLVQKRRSSSSSPSTFLSGNESLENAPSSSSDEPRPASTGAGGGTVRRKAAMPGVSRTDSGGIRAPMGWRPTVGSIGSVGGLARPSSPSLPKRRFPSAPAASKKP